MWPRRLVSSQTVTIRPNRPMAEHGIDGIGQGRIGGPVMARPRRVLIVVRVADVPVPYSRETDLRSCSTCGERVWVSRRSPTVDEYTCTRCAGNHLEEATVTPEVAAEVAALTSTTVLASAKRTLD